MDDMRQRYRTRRRDYGLPPIEPGPAPRSATNPAPNNTTPAQFIPKSLLHAYQPPPQAGPDQHDLAFQPRIQPVLEHAHPVITNRKKTKSKKKILLILVIILVLAGAGGYYNVNYYQNKSPLPKAEIQPIDFPLYYPTTLPAGYKYQLGSSKTQSGLFFYKLANGSKTILVTEQAAPPKALALSQLPNFTAVEVPRGKAVVGASLGRPSAILSTDTTLVNISSSSGVSKDEVTAAIKTMIPVDKLPAN